MKKIWWLVALVGIILLAIAAILAVTRGKRASSPKEAISVSSLISQAKGLELKGDLLEAKSAYQKLINEFSNSAEIMSWQKKAEDLNIKLIFSSTITPQSILYEIKPGDTITRIASLYKTTPELIMRSNNLSSDKIAPGKKIKVWTAPFSIVVDKSQNILVLKVNEEVFKVYTVSTGLNNSTPKGTFRILNKLINPTWFKAGTVVPAGSPENILGSRWLGFELAGYGIHGTTDPQSLGKQVTQGCVRMSNTDVEELYTLIPVGTEVTIVD